MDLILPKDWEAIDGSDPKRGLQAATIPAGRHKVEQIPNPFGHDEAPWLVLEGTMIGAAEAYWRQRSDRHDEGQVVIEE